MIYNLVENAIKYTEQGKVEFGYRIEFEQNTEMTQFEISDKESPFKLFLFVNDTGIGILDESKQLIFDPFHKIENSNKKLYRGTGVGLDLVKNLTEMLGGTVNLESKVNQGTSITIEMPVSPT